ncbi:MAG: hypothetical protein AAGA12_13110 [Pseudomonadota bacterium]
MRKLTLICAALATATTLAACDTDAERGVLGAAGGAALSKVTGGDPLTGAIIGGAAGVFCDDAGICS